MKTKKTRSNAPADGPPCPHCGRRFHTTRGLRTHDNSCPKRPGNQSSAAQPQTANGAAGRRRGRTARHPDFPNGEPPAPLAATILLPSELPPPPPTTDALDAVMAEATDGEADGIDHMEVDDPMDVDSGIPTPSAPTPSAAAPPPPSFRGVALAKPGRYPAPGTTRPVPLVDFSGIADPLLDDERLKKNPFYPFNDHHEFFWALNHFTMENSDADEQILRSAVSALLGDSTVSLPSAKTIRSRLAKSPFALPTCQTVIKDEEGRSYVFVHRKVLDAVKYLAGQVHLARDIQLSAEVHIRHGPDGPERVYSDMYTGDAWADAQMEFGKDGALMLPLIVSSDKSRVL